MKTAKVYVLYGDLSEKEIAAVRKYVINPVEAREAALEKPETLKIRYETPEMVETLDGFLHLEHPITADMLAEADRDDIAGLYLG